MPKQVLAGPNAAIFWLACCGDVAGHAMAADSLMAVPKGDRPLQMAHKLLEAIVLAHT